MTTTMRLTLLRFAAMLVAGLALALPARADANAERGKTLLEQNCARCHAIGATGDSPRREAPPFREVMKIYPASALTEALAEGLVTGHPDMPEFVFPADDVGAIASYLDTLRGDSN